MFFEPRKLFRSFCLPAQLVVCLVFAVSTGVLLALVYYLVAGALQRKDEEIISPKLKEYATVYQAGGLPGLQSAPPRKTIPPMTNPFTSTWLPNATRTRFSVPDGWMGFKIMPGHLEVQSI
jgi:hypothetical protein